jgi:hypothetical protein
MDNISVSTVQEKPDLKAIISPIIGNRRRFMLLRVSDISVDQALAMCRVKKTTYYSWLQDEVFLTIHRRRDELSLYCKSEAIQLLRKENQLAAALLEGEILDKLRIEVAEGEYHLIKTQMAREVYSRTIGSLDPAPTEVKNMTWQQQLTNIFNPQPQPQLAPVQNGGTIDGECTVSEAVSSETLEHQTCEPVQDSEQTGEQTDEISTNEISEE